MEVIILDGKLGAHKVGAKKISRRTFVKGSGALLVTFALPASAQSSSVQLPILVRSDLENRPLDGWLKIDGKGLVTVFTGKIELGNGNRTALAQIVAEELDVPFSRVKLVMGDTDLVPEQGATGGSTTIYRAGATLRQAGAEARVVLLELAAQKFGVGTEQLQVVAGVVSDRRSNKKVSYAELIGDRRFERPVTLKVKPKDPKHYRIVGQSVPRPEITDIVMGRTQFAVDLRLPGMLHGRMLRAPSYGARLVQTDLAAVKAMPGVIAVLPFSNPGDPRLNEITYTLMPGDFIGVIAEREEQAVAALAKLRTVTTWKEQDSLPPSQQIYQHLLQSTPSDATLRDDRLVDERLNFLSTQIVEAQYRVPYHSHAPIGPSHAVAQVQEGSATVWMTSQNPFNARMVVARVLGLPQEKVRVKVMDGSGVFGRNLVSDVAVDATLLAQAVPGRPVRMQWMRDEEFAWSPYRTARILQYRGGVDSAGMVSAIDAMVYLPWRPVRGFKGENLIGTYAFQTARVRERRVLSPLRSGFVRGIWHLPNAFGLESFMDELAYAANADPLEFRLRHLTDSRCKAVLTAAAKSIGYTRHIGPSKQGIGLAAALYETESATTYVAHAAQVEVNEATGEVWVKKLAVAQDCGLIINPELVRMQLEGASLQATSWALKESLEFNTKIVTSQDWNSYPILRFDEIPELSITLINRPDKPAKGVGEPATITVAPAIANAIFDATGARVREMPFTPERVRTALERL